MVKNSLETAQNTVKFDSLALLREELGKQTNNAERLGEFQKTIDEALEKGDREGVIEFTEDEWKSLITNEDLPPLEQVKELLKKKIEGMHQVKTESKEKREGIMGELDKKVDEAKKAVEEVKQKATGSVKEALSPIEKIKASVTKIGDSISDVWNNLWTPVKFAWYTLWASLGFKFGKDALAAMTKEKAEKVVGEAKKKAGEVGEKGEETAKEGKEGVIEKAAPLAIFGGAGLGVFGFIKNKIPAGLSRSLEGNGANILKNVARNRALRMFGVGGALLFGLSQISHVLEKPEIAEKVGPMPQDTEARKTWIQQVIGYCEDMSENTKNSISDFFAQSKDVITGKALDVYLTEKEKNEEIPEDMQRLEEVFGPTLKYLEDLGYDINYMAKNGAKVLAGLSVISPTIRAIALRGTMTGAQLGIFLLKGIGKNLISTLLVIGAAYNAMIIAGHKVLIPKDPNKMQEWLRDLIQLPDIREQLEKEGVDASLLAHAEENLGEAVTLLTDEEKREVRLKEEREKVMKKLTEVGLSLIAPERAKLIQSKNLEGLNHAKTSLEHFLKDPNDREKALIQQIQNLVSIVEKGGEITATDIANLITASAGTRVTIHNKNDTRYIRWSIRDEAGFLVDDKAADNLCINPKTEKNNQYHSARRMSIGQSGVLGAGAAFFEGIFEGARYPVTQLREALQTNDTKAGAQILEKILQNKIPLIRAGSEVYIDGFMFPWNTISNVFDAMNGELSWQECMMETGDGIVPMMVFGISTGVVRNGLTMLSGGKANWKFGKMLLSSSVGHMQCKMIQSGIGTVFHGPKTFQKGYEGIINMLSDKRLSIESGFDQLVEGSRKYNYFFGGSKELRNIAKDLQQLSEIKKNLTIIERASGNTDINIERKKEYAKKMKEYAKKMIDDLSPSERRNHPLAHIMNLGDNPSPESIQKALRQVNNDINVRTGRRIVLQAEQHISIRRQAEAISRLPTEHPRWARLKKAKGIAGILAIIAIPVGAALGADALNNHESANEETDNLSDSYEGPDYGEFETDISKSETINNYSPEVRGVFGEIDAIKDTLIGEDDKENMKLMLENNVNFYINTDELKAKNMIQELIPKYEASVERFRKVCRDNKQNLERYFRENPDKQDKELKVCAFLGLGWQDGQLELRFMSREKFEKHFYTTLDHVQDNTGDYTDDGIQSGWEKTGEIGKNLIPVVSSWIDTKQAYRDLSRGHIKSGLLNGGMAALGWASDISLGITAVASVLSLGVLSETLVIPAALRGAVVAAKGSKVVKGIITAERVAEVATQTAQGVYLAVEKDQKEYL